MSEPDHILFGDGADAAGLRLDALAVLLGSGLSVEIVARGRSMEPIIPDGSRLTLAPVAAAAVRIGDVVALRHGPNVRIHRILAVWRDTEGPIFVARGDSSPAIDPPRHTADLLGRVVVVQTPTARTHDLRRRIWQPINALLGRLSRHQLWTIGRWPSTPATAPAFADRPRPDTPAPTLFRHLARGGYRRLVWRVFATVAHTAVRFLP